MTDVVDALAALGGESLPLATADVGRGTSGPQGAPPPAAAAPSADVRTDTKSEAFDPAKHESDANGNGRTKRDGTWQRKRGNGARKAKGLSLSNLFGFGKDVPAPETVPGPGTAAGDEPPATGSSFLAAPGPASPGQNGTSPGEAAPEEETRHTIDAYDATAASLTHGQFAVLSLIFGPAWDAAKPERDRWIDMWRRLWFHYQLPVVGPLIELLILAVTTVSMRRNDEETKRRVSSVWRWMRGGRFKEPKDVEGEVVP